jgi:hypothetical protein
MVIDYSFIKETTYNNNGRYGSDIVEYILYKDREVLGSMVHDLYGNRAVIKFKDDRYVLTPKFLKKSEIISKNSGETIAEMSVISESFTLKDPTRHYELRGFDFHKDSFISF